MKNYKYLMVPLAKLGHEKLQHGNVRKKRYGSKVTTRLEVLLNVKEVKNRGPGKFNSNLEPAP